MTTTTDDRGDTGGAEYSGWPYWVTWVFAVALVALFALASWILYQLADDAGVDEKLWARYVYVFSALHSIVFTAIGWIFGREVHRSAASAATKDARNAKREAKAAADMATQQTFKGHALAEAVRTTAQAMGATFAAADTSTPTDPLTAQLATLKSKADKLFPEAEALAPRTPVPSDRIG